MSKNKRIYCLYMGIWLVIYGCSMTIVKAVQQREYLIESIFLSVGSMCLARAIDYYISKE
mgnify:CR=1 FL=1